MSQVTRVEEKSKLKEDMTYEQFRKAYPYIQGNLYGASERYITDLDWADIAAKFEADEELGKCGYLLPCTADTSRKTDKKVKQKRAGDVG